MDNNGKVRFDLKQVSQWDRQNEQELKKKSTAKPFTKGGFSAKKNSIFADEKEEGGGFDYGYRDRALERRKDVNTEETQMEEIVSKLDVEQTKYLGGDMEHTHLVKGLDYALLEKSRRQKEKEDEMARATAANQEPTELALHEIEPSTIVGAEVMRALRKLQLLEQQPLGRTAGSILQRTMYDFDIRPESEVEVPLLVTRSKTECNINDEYVNFMLDSAVMGQLAGLLETGKFLTAKQRRKKLQKEETERVAQMTASTPTVPSSSGGGGAGLPSVVDDFDIYGDDLVVGKYVPVGSLDDDTNASANASSSASIVVSGSEGMRTAGVSLFSGLVNDNTNSVTAGKATATATISTTTCPQDGTKKADADLMKPIRELLNAQAAKERAVKDRILAQQQQADHTRREMVLEKDEKGNLLVHRDVFATSKDKVVNVGEGKEVKGKSKLGEVFGTQGAYDLYPETTGTYTEFDSDDEAGADPAEPATKKSRLNEESSAAGGGGGKKSEWGRSGGGGGNSAAPTHVHKTGLEGIKKGGMTPWRQQPGSSSSGGGGMNRAARRAAGDNKWQFLKVARYGER